MKQNLIHIISGFIIATILLNSACKNQPEPIPKQTDIQALLIPPPSIEIERGFLNISPAPKDPSEEWTPTFHCSHKIGSTLEIGDTLKLEYTLGFTGVRCEITMKRDGGFKIKVAENIVSTPLITDKYLKICWEEDNCFIAEKNKDNTYIIKSLPFTNFAK